MARMRLSEYLLCLFGVFRLAAPQITQAPTTTIIISNDLKTTDVPTPSDASMVLYPNTTQTRKYLATQAAGTSGARLTPKPFSTSRWYLHRAWS